jgi:membrane protease YdiL (CAAX protease family)
VTLLGAVAPYAVAAAGLAVVVGWAVRVRQGHDPLGPAPSAPWPDTAFAVLAGVPAWFLCVAMIAAVRPSLGLADLEFATVQALAHAVIAFALLPVVLRGAAVPSLPAARLAAAGLLAGLATVGLVGVVGEALQAAYRLGGVAIPEQPIVSLVRGARAEDWTGVVASTAVLAPFAEEVFWRGALLPVLARRLPVASAVLAQGAAFGAIHVYDQRPAMWPLALPLALVGVLAGWAYARTRSLAVPILLHMTFNACHLAFLALAA